MFALLSHLVAGTLASPKLCNELHNYVMHYIATEYTTIVVSHKQLFAFCHSCMPLAGIQSRLFLVRPVCRQAGWIPAKKRCGNDRKKYNVMPECFCQASRLYVIYIFCLHHLISRLCFIPLHQVQD